MVELEIRKFSFMQVVLLLSIYGTSIFFFASLQLYYSKSHCYTVGILKAGGILYPAGLFMSGILFQT